MSFLNIKNTIIPSVTFSGRNLRLVREYADITGGKGVNVLNFIVDMMLAMPEKVRMNLLEFCQINIQQIEQNMAKREYSNDLSVKRRVAYQRLERFLSDENCQMDIPKKEKGEKIKRTIEFTATNYGLVKEKAKKEKTTFGRYVNYLIVLTLDIPEEVKSELSVFSSASLNETIQHSESKSRYINELSREMQMHYKKMELFWCNNQRAAFDGHKSMKKIDMKDGYIIYPSDWVVLEDVLRDPKESSRASGVEVYNGRRYGMPHFLLFSNIAKNESYTEDEFKIIEAACLRANSRFADVLKDEQSMVDEEKPVVGVFNIIATDDPYYDEFDTPPFGCKIIRDISKSKD